MSHGEIDRLGAQQTDELTPSHGLRHPFQKVPLLVLDTKLITCGGSFSHRDKDITTSENGCPSHLVIDALIFCFVLF